jgi:hypothetical protein
MLIVLVLDVAWIYTSADSLADDDPMKSLIALLPVCKSGGSCKLCVTLKYELLAA